MDPTYGVSLDHKFHDECHWYNFCLSVWLAGCCLQIFAFIKMFAFSGWHFGPAGPSQWTPKGSLGRKNNIKIKNNHEARLAALLSVGRKRSTFTSFELRWCSPFADRQNRRHGIIWVRTQLVFGLPHYWRTVHCHDASVIMLPSSLVPPHGHHFHLMALESKSRGTPSRHGLEPHPPHPKGTGKKKERPLKMKSDPTRVTSARATSPWPYRGHLPTPLHRRPTGGHPDDAGHKRPGQRRSRKRSRPAEGLRHRGPPGRRTQKNDTHTFLGDLTWSTFLDPFLLWPSSFSSFSVPKARHRVKAAKKASWPSPVPPPGKTFL